MADLVSESRDGNGCGDHDKPYDYPHPTATWNSPFTWREFLHLLIYRGRFQDGKIVGDTWPTPWPNGAMAEAES